MSHNINDLYDTMFATLKSLRDKDNPMDIDRAKAICEVGQVIVNTAKVEIDHMRLSGGNGSGFIATTAIPAPPDQQKPTQTVHEQPSKRGITVEKVPGGTITRHRLT